METFELRYFLAVARHQNIHTAAKQNSVSPGALSKAVSRLELELGVKLFTRLGRNIGLTEHGRVLQTRAAEIIRLEEAAKLEIQGKIGRLNIIFAGPEIVLGNIGFDIAMGLRKRHPNSSFEFLSAHDEDAVAMVSHGTAHLAISTLSPSSQLTSKTVKKCVFQTIVGPKHPLYSEALNGKTVAVEKLLEHPFVCPSRGFLGRIQNEQSSDGWRDDVFARRIEYVTSSLKLIESIVSSGQGLAYLPNYLVEKMDALPLKVSGCPYSCHQEIKLIAKNPEAASWMKRLF